LFKNSHNLVKNIRSYSWRLDEVDVLGYGACHLLACPNIAGLGANIHCIERFERGKVFESSYVAKHLSTFERYVAFFNTYSF
jgi:hypothetical protein